MKRRYVLVLIIMIALLSLFNYSCNLLPISIQDRIESFEYDLNNNRSKAYLNFHENLTDQYDYIRDPDFWNLCFDSEKIPYTITVEDASTPDEVICSIYGKDALYTFGPEIRFKMAKDGANWMIEEIPYLAVYSDTDPFPMVVD